MKIKNDGEHDDKLFGVLSSTDVESAEASMPSDRENILDIVVKKTGGYDQFNIKINQLIRTWVLQLIKDAARSRLEDIVDGDYDEDCAIFHQHIGSLFGRLGELENAMEMFRVELKMKEKKFGSDNLEMIYPLNILNDQGKHEEALENFMKSLIIQEKEYGRDNVKVGRTLNNMGVAYQLLGEDDKAIDVLNRALAIQKDKLGPDHIRTARTRMNIALVLDNQEKYDEVIEKYNKSDHF